ncbi:MAG TPA: hypothetical protein VGS06_45215 [Streptosporangiaceae bacterium]|nr:hypothetical protein [Streptosporangiaceae bacterium]
MLDKVTIAYRGGTYEIGRGRDYFGIWTIAGSRSQPLEWWPETQEGWSAAWTRFAVLEAPDAITSVGRTQTRPGERSDAARAPAIAARRGGAIVAALLLGVGVALGIAGLFPDYLGGTSLAAQPDNLVAHVIYLAAWTAGGVLIALGGARVRVGALLATGLSIVTFGLFLADAGTPIAGGAHLAGAGLVLSLLGWLACAAGSALAFLIRPARNAGPVPAPGPVSAAGQLPAAGPVPARDPAGTRGRLLTLGWPRGAALGPAVLLVLAGLGTAAAFVPSWDSFTLRAATGQTQTFAAGNAFTNPGPVIAGNVVVMVALAAVVIAAALWRPARHGAVLLAGAIIPMAAQAISALVQVGEPTSPAQFGFTPAQISQLGLTVSNGLTPSFWIFSVLVVVLVVSCAWMLFIPLTPHDAAGAASAGMRAGDNADSQVPTWHVARADAYDMTGAPAPAVDDDWDIDDGTESGKFDSYEAFGSDNPADSTVTPGSTADDGDQPGPRE